MAVSIIRALNCFFFEIQKRVSFFFFKIIELQSISPLLPQKANNKFPRTCNQEVALRRKKKNYEIRNSRIFPISPDNFQRSFANYYSYHVQLSRNATTYNRC